MLMGNNTAIPVSCQWFEIYCFKNKGYQPEVSLLFLHEMLGEILPLMKYSVGLEDLVDLIYAR